MSKDATLKVNATMDALLTAAVARVPESALEQWLGKVHCGDCIELIEIARRAIRKERKVLEAGF